MNAKARMDEPGMKASVMVNLACGVAAALTGSALGHGPANAREERVWTLSGLEEKKPDSISLAYAVPESDYVTFIFSCKPKSGEVSLVVAETSVKLKPGKKATAELSVRETRASAAGKLTPNEEAGAPSFEGRLPASDPIFAAMAAGGTLAVAVGPSRETAPLKGAADKIGKFAAACAKP
jgi:hypothetical protein